MSIASPSRPPTPGGAAFSGQDAHGIDLTTDPPPQSEQIHDHTSSWRVRVRCRRSWRRPTGCPVPQRLTRGVGAEPARPGVPPSRTRQQIRDSSWRCDIVELETNTTVVNQELRPAREKQSAHVVALPHAEPA